jgi:uncharacterized protein (TIGR03435 family)
VRLILGPTRACALLHAQPRAKPQFEVAPVKPADPRGSQPHGLAYECPGTSRLGRKIACTNLNLKYLVELAYSVNRYQLSAFSRTDEQHFDIVAEARAGLVTNRERRMPMR